MKCVTPLETSKFGWLNAIKVWAYDFVEDRTETGRKLRVLTIVDELTRECVEVEVEHRMNAKLLAGALLRLFEQRGTPAFIRSDNRSGIRRLPRDGPEFIAKFLMRVFAIHGVAARHIEPGSPWQNGLNERFNGALRDECLNSETFHNRDHARALIKLYARHYNERRPHSSLSYQTPSELAAKWRRENADEKDGCAGGEGVRLSLCASSGREEQETGSGPTAAEALPWHNDRPDDRRMIQAGAQVARQQSLVSRLNGVSVPEKPEAGKVPAQKLVEVPGSL